MTEAELQELAELRMTEDVLELDDWQAESEQSELDAIPEAMKLEIDEAIEAEVEVLNEWLGT